jgi:hypothetical protein
MWCTMPAVKPQMAKVLKPVGVEIALLALEHAAGTRRIGRVRAGSASGTWKMRSTSAGLGVSGGRPSSCPNDRIHPVASARGIARQEPAHFHRMRRQVDFLHRLTQRRVARALARIDTPAGKGDLPGMGAERAGAHRQRHVRLRLGHIDRDQHSSRFQTALGARGSQNPG